MRNEKKKNWYRFPIQTWITLGTLAIGALNFGIAYKLSPIVEDLHLLNTRVEAIETSRVDTKPLVERFFKLEENVRNIQEDVRELLVIHQR